MKDIIPMPPEVAAHEFLSLRREHTENGTRYFVFVKDDPTDEVEFDKVTDEFQYIHCQKLFAKADKEV